MHRDTGHHHRLACALAALGQRDAQQSCSSFGIFKKELVEVAHPIEEEGIGHRGLDAQELLHHRRVAAEVCHVVR